MKKIILNCILLCCAAMSTANAQILVKLTDHRYVEQLDSLPACKGISYIMPHTDSTFISVRYDTSVISEIEMLESLKALDYVSSAARNRKIQLPIPEPGKTFLEDSSQRSPMRSVVDSFPNDPLFDQQWGLKAINMPQLWKVPLKPGAKRPVIAIVDSGVDIEHPDLKDNIWTNEAELNGLPGVDDDGNGFIDDIHGWDVARSVADVSDISCHGTHCAGIAAAIADNGIGIAGADPNAIIMPVKVMGIDGLTSDEEVVAGIDYAISNGADIVNLSLGSDRLMPDEDDDNYLFLADVLSRYSERAILVGSSGNSGFPISSEFVCDFASLPFVIGVENTTETGNLNNTSNYDDDLGPWASSWKQGFNYELSAPGTNIMSTLPNGEYGQLSGTSMSAPLVSGVISRLISVKDYESRDELVHDLIFSRGRLFGPIDAMAAYTGILTRLVRLSFQQPDPVVFEKKSSFTFTVLNDIDSIQTDLRVEVNMVNPDDTVKVRLLASEFTIPVLEPDETGLSLDIPCQVNGIAPEDRFPVSFSVYQGEEVVCSSIYSLHFYENQFSSDSISYAVMDSIQHTAQILEYCGNADVLILPDTVVLDGQKMTIVSIGKYAFRSHANLIEVDIPNSVKEIGGYAFKYCSSLKRVHLPDSLEIIGTDAFARCPSLEQIYIPDNTRMIGDGAFYYCNSLESIHLPDSLVELGLDALYGCGSLTSVEIPQSVRSILKGAFRYCISLKSIELPSSLDFLSNYVFCGCTSLVSAVIPGSIRIVDKYEFGDCKSLESVQLGEGLRYIGEAAFESCGSLTSIVFPQSLDSIESNAFKYCNTLKSVTCLSSVPPVIFGEDSPNRLGNPADESTLYVPQGCADAYRAAEGWKLFGTIREIVPTSVTPVSDGANPMPEYYMNRHILIRDGQKYLTAPVSGL